jgi:uncharacterized protein
MERAIDEKRRQLAQICRQHRVRRLVLFGSALREDFDPERSDLDFLVEFEPLPPGEYASTYFRLSEALAELFGRDIDLIEAGSVRNPYLKQAIEAQQETVYGA